MTYFRREFLDKKSFLKEDKPVKAVKGSDSMKAFWDYHLKEIAHKTKCQESGELIFPNVSSICHIFPKAKYPSVAAHLANCMYFHVDVHSRFDRLLGELDFVKLEQEFPNSWPEVIEKVVTLLPLVKEQGKLKTKFEDYLKDK